MTDTVKQLLIINVLFFIGSYFVPNTVGLLALNYVENEHFGIWQIVTSMFMHGSLMHILFNMYALITFGSVLEQMWGSKKFLFYYFSSGIIGSMVYIGYNYFEFYNAISPLISSGMSKIEILNSLNSGNLSPFNGVINQDQFNSISNVYYGKSLGASGAIYGL
jgi:membrane associated rhomboid family serine protease